MRIQQTILTILWISLVGLTGCVSSKDKVFGTDMPLMTEIHDEKFNQDSTQVLDSPMRAIEETPLPDEIEFLWLPNPVMTMYVTPHLTKAGYPIPGYSTYFRFFNQEHLAEPSEVNGWD